MSIEPDSTAVRSSSTFNIPCVVISSVFNVITSWSDVVHMRTALEVVIRVVDGTVASIAMTTV